MLIHDLSAMTLKGVKNMKFKIPLINSMEIDIEINQSEKVVFLGANGSGKSRLGEFINKIVHNQTSSGIEQLKNQISFKKQELNLITTALENLISKFSEIDSLSDQQVFQYGQQYQNGLIPIGGGEVKTRIDILNLFFANKIQVGNVTFAGVNIIGSTPPRSLEDIDGGTISFGDLTFDIGLMKINESKPETLNNAREHLKSQVGTQLKIEQDKEINSKNELEKLEKDLESSQITSFDFSHRVAAHRSLVINENSQFSSFQDAKNKLLYGSTHQFNNNFSKNNSVGAIQNDYADLISSFISEEAELGAKLNQQHISKEAATTKLSQTIDIWNSLMVNKKLSRDGLKIEIIKEDGSKYLISKLSEGERSILYIIGQCLFAPENSIIIIDEPDLHIHKSIMLELFDLIETQRKDCAFIYITHDMDFISSRIGKKYAIKDFHRSDDQGNQDKWNIIKIEQIEEIPEDILNLILGSRKPILFVEGEENKSSLDRMYHHIYPDFKVILTGNCRQVINMTKAGNLLNPHHNLACFGLIDADGRTDVQLRELESEKIYCLPVAIIENIFLLPDVAEVLYKITGMDSSFNRDEFIKKAIQWLKMNQNWQSKTAKEKMSRYFDDQIKGLKSIEDFKDVEISINPKYFIDETTQYWDEIIQQNDSIEKMIELLKLNRGKGILSSFAKDLKLKDQRALEERIVINVEILKEVLKNQLPSIIHT